MSNRAGPLLGQRRGISLGAGTPTLPNPDYGRDLRVWMQQSTAPGSVAYANGGTLYLPSGLYYGGPTGDVRGSAYAHPYDTSRPRNGYLHLKAFESGGVSLDFSATAAGFVLTDPTNGGALSVGSINDQTGVASLRIIFEDLTHKWGIWQLCGTDRVRWFNCRGGDIPRGALDGSTTGSWQAQFNAVCTALGAPVVTAVPDTAQYRTVRDHPYGKNNLATPTGWRLDHGADYTPTNIWIVNCDAHDVCDDGIYLGGLETYPNDPISYAQQARVQGCRVWNVNNGSLGNPGVGGAGPLAWYHNDSIQMIGHEYDMLVADCMLGQHIQIEAHSVPIDRTAWDRIWQFGAPAGSAGMSLDNTNGFGVGPHGHIGGSLDDQGNATFYHWFANGQPYNGGAYDAGTDVAVAVTGVITMPTTLVNSLPSGVTITAGVIADINEILNHVDNPALLYRAGHADMDTVFAGTYD